MIYNNEEYITIKEATEYLNSKGINYCYNTVYYKIKRHSKKLIRQGYIYYVAKQQVEDLFLTIKDLRNDN